MPRRIAILPPNIDTIPNSFSFVDQTDVALSSVITSAPVTILGINAPTPITVSGGSYDINGSGSFTSSPGIVISGNTVRARLTSSSSNSTAANVTVTVGGVSDTFTATTLAGSSGFDLYFSPTGTGSAGAGGTLADPWGIAMLGNTTAQQRMRGLTVGFLDGTYLVTGSGEALLNFSNGQGTAGFPTTLKAVNARQAVITTNNGGTYPAHNPGCPAVLVLNSDWVVIDGLKFSGMSGHAIALQDASNIVVRNAWIEDILTSRNPTQADSNCGGLYFLTQAIVKDTVLVENCLFKNIFNNNTTVLGNTSNGVGDLFGARNVTIRNCTFVNMGTASYWKGQAGGHLFENNFCYNLGEGLQSFSTVGSPPGNPASNIARGNIFVCNSMGGPPSSNNNGAASSICTHHNNTYVMKSIGGLTEGADFGWIVLHGSGGAQTFNFYNNVVSLDAALSIGPGILRQPATDNSGTCVSLLSKVGTMDNNVWNRFTVANDPAGGFHTTLGSWQSASGKEAGSIVAAPDLVNISGSTVADFAPNPASPAVARSAGHTYYGTSWGADFAQAA